MNENYTIKISGANDKVNATITGGSFFGVRHGLETLSQLILYDDIRDHLLVRYIGSMVDSSLYLFDKITVQGPVTVDVFCVLLFGHIENNDFMKIASNWNKNHT